MTPTKYRLLLVCEKQNFAQPYRTHNISSRRHEKEKLWETYDIVFVVIKQSIFKAIKGGEHVLKIALCNVLLLVLLSTMIARQ